MFLLVNMESCCDDFEGFTVAMLLENHIKKLVVFLTPTNTPNNWKTLAGQLHFVQGDVVYMETKEKPVVYLLQTWARRDDSAATLKRLYDELVEIQRFDVTDYLTNTVIPELRQTAQSQSTHIELQRCESNTTLFNESSFIESPSKIRCSPRPAGESSKVATETVQSVCDETMDDSKPTVFVLYYPDNPIHVSNVKKFCGKLKKNYGIDVSLDDEDDESCDDNRAMQTLAKIQAATFVLVICSPGYMNCVESPDPESYKAKEITFILKIIADEIFKNSMRNPKYIPVLLAKLCQHKHIPQALRSYYVYKIPTPADYRTLTNRLLGKEGYRLCESAYKAPTQDVPDLKPSARDIYQKLYLS